MKAPLVQSSRALRRGALALALGLAAACSSSSESPDSGVVVVGSVVQDLDEDADGQTLILAAPGFASRITTGSVEASGGQVAQSVFVSGDDVAVVFDQRVTPSHQVRIVGLTGVSSEWRAVTTSDPRAPQMTIISATQDVSDNALGGDQIVVGFVAGPRMIESEVEDITNWTLTVDGVQLDLSGSTIVHDVNSQVATFTLGGQANLHANFGLAAAISTVADNPISQSTVAGAATGDTTAPTLEGGSPVTQDITAVTGDESGHLLLVDFSEPISPVFGATPSNFSVIDHGDAQGLTVVSRVSADPLDNSVLRINFTRPVVPGLDQLSIGGVLDAHGNAFTPQTSAIAAGSTVTNGFTSVDFTTVEGANNDRLVAVLDQAIDPDTAQDPTRWTLDVDDNPVDLATQQIDYDLTTRTVTFSFDFDAVNGVEADLASDGVVDIDGETFAVAAAPAPAAGDSGAPTILGMTQNRNADATGRAVDVAFSEDLDVTTATDAANYVFAPSVSVQSVTLLDGSTVRLSLQDPVVPGDHALTVLEAVSDPAGNDLGADVGPGALTSTDTTPPALLSGSAVAVEGAENDTLFAFFNDTLVESEIEDLTRWTLEGPSGDDFALTGSTVDYDTVTGIATLTLDGAGAPSFTVGESFTLTIAGVRDIGGNAAASTDTTGVAGGERRLPNIDGIFARPAANELNLRFNEPMGSLGDLYDASTNQLGARYEVIDPITSQTSYPIAATVVDRGLGVVLTYATAIDPAAEVNVIGLRDLAGNPLFPALGGVIVPHDGSAPAIGGTPPSIDAVQGVDNDEITIVFDTAIATWNATNPASYRLVDVTATQTVDLSAADIRFDGDRTVTIVLGAGTGSAADAGHTYDVSVEVLAEDPIRTVQGEAITSTALAAGIAVGGDNAAGPSQAGTVAFTDPGDSNALYVVFDETVDETAAQTSTAYDYNNGTIATSATLVEPRAVRLVFPSAVAAGGTLDVTNVAAVDTAQNAAAGTLSLAVVEDTTAPFIASSSASIQEGVGGDVIQIVFDEQVDTNGGLDVEDFTVTVGGVNQRLGTVLWDPQTFTASILVEDMFDGTSADVSIDGIVDLAGNAPAAALTTSVVVGGDTTAPSVVVGFVNDAIGASGVTVDVLFSEDVLPAFVTAGGNWSASDGETVVFAEMLEGNAVRLTLSGPLDVGATLTLAAGLGDYAGNQEGSAIVIDPVR